MKGMLEALAKYGRHLPECCRHRATDFGCICGLNDHLGIATDTEKQAYLKGARGMDTLEFRLSVMPMEQ